MVYLVAYALFLGLAAMSWICSIAFYRALFDSPSPAAGYGRLAAIAIGLVALTGFIQFPAGYVAGSVVWAIAVYRFLPLPASRATALVSFLVAMGMVTRLLVVGVLEYGPRPSHP